MILSSLMLAIVFLSNAQTVDSKYEVATWQGFTDAAITYTFDDNCPNQYSVAIPMFNEFDFEGTFYPIISREPQWDIFQNAVREGHEIGSHTVSHSNLSELDDVKQEEELKNSKEEIERRISGQKCKTIAYPFCVPSKIELTNKYFIAARHCQGNIEKSTPENFFEISSILCGNIGHVKTTNDFITKNESAASLNGWCVYLLHGIEKDGGYSPLDSVDLLGGLEFLDRNRDKYWVSTFTDVVQYIRERNSASVTELEATNQLVKIVISDTLDNSIYKTPITIRRSLPAKWTNADVLQGNSVVRSNVVEKNAVKYVEFDVVPDAGIVEIQLAEVN